MRCIFPSHLSVCAFPQVPCVAPKSLALVYEESTSGFLNCGVAMFCTWHVLVTGAVVTIYIPINAACHTIAVEDCLCSELDLATFQRR